MLIGVGYLGTYILEFLARMPNVGQLTVADVDEEKVRGKVNNALLGALLHGTEPSIDHKRIDLFDVDGTAEILDSLHPDLIINSAVLQTWFKIRELPPQVYAKLSTASLGAWLPTQLTLVYKLMSAIRVANLKVPVVNASLPDIVNPVLAKVDLAPRIGMGNVDMIVAGVRKVVGRKLGISAQDVNVFMVGHHVHFASQTDPGYRKAPYLLEIFVDGQRVTTDFNLDELVVDAVRIYPPGLDFNSVTASSGIKNAMAILNNTRLLTHAPGPNGLPGGYPVRIGSKRTDVVLPRGISLEDAVRVNTEAQKSDGIAEIRNDGTVVFEDYAVEIFKELLGYECKQMRVDESEGRASELMKKYEELAAKYR